MESEGTTAVEIALVNLAFAQAELALSEDLSPGNRRAFEHIKLAIAELSRLSRKFGHLEEVAA